MMQISFGVSNSTVLMKPCADDADDGRRQEGDEDAEHEAPRPRVARQVGSDLPQPAGIDA